MDFFLFFIFIFLFMRRFDESLDLGLCSIGTGAVLGWVGMSLLPQMSPSALLRLGLLSAAVGLVAGGAFIISGIRKKELPERSAAFMGLCVGVTIGVIGMRSLLETSDQKAAPTTQPFAVLVSSDISRR